MTSEVNLEDSGLFGLDSHGGDRMPLPPEVDRFPEAEDQAECDL